MDVKFYWELPTNQSNLTNCDYIRYNAKLHCYVNDKSLCKRHSQQTESFENYDIEEFLKEYGEKYVCSKCLVEYRKATHTMNVKRR